MAKAINIFDDENFSKGQGIFPDGPTRWDSFRFGTFDFGTPGNDQVVLIGQGQPLNPDGTENGEVRPVRWGCTMGREAVNDVELVGPVKGEKGAFKGIAISESNKHGKVFGLADFAIFRDHLKAAAKLNPELIDMDEAGTDITVLDGLLTEVSKFTKPEQKSKVAADTDAKGKAEPAKKAPWQVVVITELLDPKKFGKGGAKPKAKPPVEEDEDDKLTKAKTKTKSKAKEVSDDPDDIVAAYLDSELTDDKAGDNPLAVKIGVSAWAIKTLGKDADVAREAQSNLKENMAILLKARGWKIEKGLLAKED